MQSLLEFKSVLNSYAHHAEIGIDFREAKWATPFYLLMASTAINHFKHFSSAKIHCIGHEKHTYFAHMGFFCSFGLMHGNKPGEAYGSLDYLPISIYESNEIRREAEIKNLAVGEIMEMHSGKLACILARSNSGALFDTLQFCMREILRNVVEHSGSQRIAFSAQHYPKQGKVEVAISDWGCGIKKGIEGNPQIKFNSHKDAICGALMPGTSGKEHIVKKLKNKSVWTNSGFGLYMTSRLCREAGSFLIGSGDASLILTSNSTKYSDWGFPGTSICMDFRAKQVCDLQEMSSRFRSDADTFKKIVGKKGLLDPSISSLALQRDFDKYL